MAFHSSDFADDTDYERLVLDRLGTHRVRPADPDMIYHLESEPKGRGSISLAVQPLEEGGQRVAILKETLQPLGFGAAYKTLDLLVEHILRANGTTGRRLTFVSKISALKSRPAVLPAPLDKYPEYWDRLARLFMNFNEARHALAHRRAEVAGSDLRVYDDAGQPLDTVTGDEVEHFAAVVHILAALVVDRSYDSRRIKIAAWYLNQLQPRHQLPHLPATDPGAGSGLLKASLAVVGDELRFDVARARQAMEGQRRARWDLELLYEEDQAFYGRWEDVPDKDADSYQFNPSLPPPWLARGLAKT